MGKIATLPHPVPHKPVTFKRPEKHGHGTAIALTAAALAAGLVGIWLLVQPGAPQANLTDTLLDQMHSAASGNAIASHAYGGGLTVTHGNGRKNVTAEGLPGKACVQVGWHLAKEGTIIVNGVMPARLSAAKLSELCSDGDGGATLTWVPDEAGQ